MTPESYDRATEINKLLREKRDLLDKIKNRLLDFEKDYPNVAEAYRTALANHVNHEIAALEEEFANL